MIFVACRFEINQPVIKYFLLACRNKTQRHENQGEVNPH